MWQGHFIIILENSSFYTNLHNKIILFNGIGIEKIFSKSYNKYEVKFNGRKTESL